MIESADNNEKDKGKKRGGQIEASRVRKIKYFHLGNLPHIMKPPFKIFFEKGK